MIFHLGGWIHIFCNCLWLEYLGTVFPGYWVDLEVGWQVEKEGERQDRREEFENPPPIVTGPVDGHGFGDSQVPAKKRGFLYYLEIMKKGTNFK